MAGAATSSLLGIGKGLIFQILGGIAILMAAVGLYYLVRWIQKGTKRQKAFTTTAVIWDMNGVIDFDKLAFVKSEDSGLLEMVFQTRKTDSVPPIPKHLIKQGYVLLLNYAPGHYCVIDTSATINNLMNGTNLIIPFNLGMKKYITSKQREILNRAEKRKQKWEQYAPWVTSGSAIISLCLLGFFLFYFGAKVDNANIAARLAECVKGVR